MDKNPAELDASPAEEEKQAAVERALELEQLEDREFQGTYRNDSPYTPQLEWAICVWGGSKGGGLSPGHRNQKYAVIVL